MASSTGTGARPAISVAPMAISASGSRIAAGATSAGGSSR